MRNPKNLMETVVPSSAAERLLEATLPVATGHGEGNGERVTALLAENPAAACADVWVASATGQLAAVREFLAADADLANARGGTRHWEPLLYLCFSRVLWALPERREDMHAVAALLLEHGADANACWFDDEEETGNRESAIYGAAGIANDVQLTTMLLAAGADPNDGETAYHFVEHAGVPCAEVLWPALDAMNRGTALLHKLDYPDLEGLRRLLELGADPDGESPFGKHALHQAVFRGHPKPYFDLLLGHGADPDLPDHNGRTPYALAARSGRSAIMAWLAEGGAATDLEPNDAFLAACTTGDETAARLVLTENPNLLESLNEADRAQICEVADGGNVAGIRLMLELGWEVNTPGLIWGETALHRAAMQGHIEVARVLYEHGADLTLRDRCYDASPIGWASHGDQPRLVQFLVSDPARLDARDLALLTEGSS